MTLPAGAIAMSDVSTELGKSSTANTTLNDTNVRQLANGWDAGTAGYGNPIGFNNLQSQQAYRWRGVNWNSGWGWGSRSNGYAVPWDYNSGYANMNVNTTGAFNSYSIDIYGMNFNGNQFDGAWSPSSIQVNIPFSSSFGVDITSVTFYMYLSRTDLSVYSNPITASVSGTTSGAMTFDTSFAAWGWSFSELNRSDTMLSMYMNAYAGKTNAYAFQIVNPPNMYVFYTIR